MTFVAMVKLCFAVAESLAPMVSLRVLDDSARPSPTVTVVDFVALIFMSVQVSVMGPCGALKKMSPVVARKVIVSAATSISSFSLPLLLTNVTFSAPPLSLKMSL